MVTIMSLHLTWSPRLGSSSTVAASPARSVRFPYTHRPSILQPARPPSRFTRIYGLTSNDIKVGLSVEVDGAPWKVLEFLHVKPGKGAAFVRTKMRNYLTGNVVEKTFRAGSPLQEADMSKEAKQFSYKDGSTFVFMDMNTYEELRVEEEDIGEKSMWLKEGLECNLFFWNGNIIDCELPVTVKLIVTEVGPGGGDNSAQGGTKRATLETGAQVVVPVYMKEGEEILVDTRTGQYAGRA